VCVRVVIVCVCVCVCVCMTGFVCLSVGDFVSGLCDVCVCVCVCVWCLFIYVCD